MPSRFGSVEVDKCLIAMIVHGGNSVKAAGAVKSQGIDISDRALRDWVQGRHADRYHELQAEHAPKIAELIAATAEALAVQFADAEQEALALLREKMPTMTGAELSGAVRNLSTSKALQVDKISSPLRGRPTTITEHRDPTQAIRELAKALGKEHILESTAEDITDRKEIEGA